MENYITFWAPIKKKCGDSKTITHKLRFIDSFSFILTSWSDLVDNMSGNFNSIECNHAQKIIDVKNAKK